jgi:hypothetical protein
VNPSADVLNAFAKVLEASGYSVGYSEFPSVGRVLLAETPDALVCCFHTEHWGSLRQDVSDAQASLTQLAAEVPSARRWDMYLVVHLPGKPPGLLEEAAVEAIEADTSYMRKFVRMGVVFHDSKAVERALRQLLPLQSVPVFDIIDPLELLRNELRELDIAEEIAATAIASFQLSSEVSVP